MTTKLAPAHRELDGHPIKTGDIARLPTRDRTPKRPRVRAHPRARDACCPYPDCPCQEEELDG